MKMDLMNSWLKNIERSSSKNTFESYSNNMRQLYKNFQEKFNTNDEIEMLRQIDNTCMEKFLDELEGVYGYARSSINSKIITWNLFFEYCQSTKGIITINPLNKVKPFSNKKVKETEKNKYIPTKNDIEKLINACDSRTAKQKNFDLISKRNKAIISVLATTGLRISELAQSKMSDLEELDGAVMLNIKAEAVKTSVKKRVPITGISLKYFKDYIIEKKLSKYADSEFIFISSNGKEINRRNYNNILESLVDKANIDTNGSSFSVHNFRHFTATMLSKDANNSVMVINSLMGWSNGGGMINRYSHDTYWDKEKIDMCKKILG